MLSVVTDVAWSVCVLVTTMNRAQKAELVHYCTHYASTPYLLQEAKPVTF